MWVRAVKRGALALVWVLTVGSAAPSSAEPIVGYATGFVKDVQVEGEGGNVFGLGAEGLDGEAARIDFRYVTDLAPPDTNPAEDRGRFETTGTDRGWLEMSITLNDRVYDVAATFRYADMQTGSGPPLHDSFQLTVERSVPVENGNRREFIELILDLPPGSVPSGSLPTHVPATAPFGQAVNGVSFSINDFDVDPESQLLTYVRVLRFDLDITEIAIFPVPEPASELLVAFALITLGARRRFR